MKELSVNSFLFLFFAGVVVLISYSTEYIVEYVNDILVPCQHDSVLVDGECACDNTNGVFGGQYCETCLCGHSGICGVSPKNRSSTSRWACRCPSSQKWVGTTCNNCYATEHTPENCRGDCVSSRTAPAYYHSGPQCNTVCMPKSNSMNLRCLEVVAGGGTCNACNGHGSCTSTGGCECDTGWFTSRAGEQCSQSCADADIPCEHGTCVALGGELQCGCDSGWFGPLCNQTCSATVTTGSIPCSGHGTCGYNAQNNLQCACDQLHKGEFCEYKCPTSNEEPCSGHGICAVDNGQVSCTCRGDWASDDCSCSPTATCSGHGTCLVNGTCDCFDMTEPSDAHWFGKTCGKCQENWHGTNCQLYCDDTANYTSNDTTIGRRIGCNNHGSCNVLQKNMVEQVICVCDKTNEETHCATCMPNYYPDIRLENMTVSPCSVPCGQSTCSHHGVCNPHYNGSNNLCICDPVRKNGHELHTLDANKFCSTCRKNWYPTTMGSADRCSYYCASDGTITTENGTDVVKFGDSDLTLQGDADAQKVCVAKSEGYGADLEFSPDPDCRVCSGGGKCQSSGQCLCDPGHTGSYCEIDCNTIIIDGVATMCSGHGRCVRNDLELWFNPGSKSYRCECQPYDPYTSETRLRLMKRGVELAPPPSPDYYGEHCGYHCPRYNEEICAGRGTCTTAVAYNEYGAVDRCHNDTQCQTNTVEGEVRFCARETTPWDSGVSDGGFFSGAGYTACASDQSCYESILDIEWDRFCVNMLADWYPSSMNTPTCTYSSPECQAAIESFFVDPYAGNNTWCEQVKQELMPSLDVCHADSHKNALVYDAQSQPLCYGYTLEFTCSGQDSCVYDQSYSYIDDIDQKCAAATDKDCTGPCGINNNNTCVVQTYCRAKHCRDIIDANPLESMCFDAAPTACSGSSEEWTNTCANITGELQKHRFGRAGYNTTSDMFFSCAMYSQRDYPLRIEASIPGNIDISGVVTLSGKTDVHVSSLRRAFIDSRPTLAVSDCRNDLDALILDGFCDKHLVSLVPTSVPTSVPTTTRETPYMVYCNGHVESLWSQLHLATKRLQALQFSGCDIVPRTQSVNYSPWSLNCLNRDSKVGPSFNLSLYPDTWTSCTFEVDKKLLAWVGSPTSPVEQCKAGMEAPWMQRAQPTPTLCDLGACHPNDACYLCDDPRVTCDSAADVFCKADLATNCEANRCQLNGTCFQGSMRHSKSYMCTFSGDLPAASVLNQTEVCHKVTKNYNWYDECANNSEGQDLATHGGDGLKKSWSITGHVRAEDQNSVVLSHPSTAKAPNTTDVQATWSRSSDSAIEATCHSRTVRIYGGQGIAVSGDKTITLSNETKTVAANMAVRMTNAYIYLYAPACQITLTTIYGTTTLVTLQRDGDSAFLPFGETSVDGRRVDDGVTFEGNDMQLVRQSSTGLNGCTIDASGSTNCTGVQPVVVGAQWHLPFSDSVRVSGWVRSDHTDQKVANVDVLDSKGTPVVSMYVYQHVVWLNRHKTGCTINNRGRWWSWSLDVASAHAHWDVRLEVAGCEYNTTVPMSSSTLERQHDGRVAPSFLSMASTRHGCRRACQDHMDCVQWSHTTVDHHCYLYNQRCHEDAQCVDGTHTLHAFHPHALAAVNVYNSDRNTTSWWTSMRVDRLLPVPSSIATACALPTEDLSDRWVAAFSDTYAPFMPDVTHICRGFRTRWSGQTTTSTTDDLKFCADYQQYRAPALRPASCDDSTWALYEGMNWTAYCGYRQSFEVKGDQVPFMGGPICPGGTCGSPDASVDMATLCHVSETIRNSTDCVSNEWYASCLGRTDIYRAYCSDTCVQTITDMFGSQSVCEKRRKLANMVTNGTETNVGKSCTDCDLGGSVLTDFCLRHGMYHRNNHILIPELSHSHCSGDCLGLLKKDMTLNQWRGWCQSLANKTLLGVCSTTVCDCDAAYLGVGGSLCELACPVGSDNGQELACSGRNGECVAENSDLLVADARQKTSTLREYRNSSSRTGLVPVWMKGPDSNMEGVCQCQLGSGLACSIPCEKCNNGTYGYSLASQYGICDTLNGICRGLAPFMRYDIHKASDDLRSYNSTLFDETKWHKPYFLYESDVSLFKLALKYIRDKTGSSIEGVPVNRTSHTTLDLDNTLDIFRDVCYNRTRDYATHGTYLNNSEQVTLGKVVFNAASTNQTLATFSTPSIQSCLELHVSEALYLCYNGGTWSAYDTNQRSLQMHVSAPGQLPETGVAFAQTHQSDLYMFGGTGVYHVTYRRLYWQPVDVVYVQVNSVSTTGTAPPAHTTPWMWATPNALYVLSQNKCMYKLQFPTLTSLYHEWTQESCQQFNNTVRHIRQQDDQLYVYTADSNHVEYVWTYQNQTWQEDGPVRQPVVFEPQHRLLEITGEQYDCTLEVNLSYVRLGNRTLAAFDNTSETLGNISVFSDDLVDIDPRTGADITTRVLNTVLWQPAEPVDTVPSSYEIYQALDLVNRLYMHQGRWDIPTQFTTRAMLSNRTRRFSPTGHTAHDTIMDGLASVNPDAFFKDIIMTTLTRLSISRTEGPQYNRKVSIYATRIKPFESYKQTLAVGTISLDFVLTWNDNIFNLQIKRPEKNGVISWKLTDAPYMTFALVVHLEAWHSNPETLSSKSTEPRWARVFDLYVAENELSHYNVVSRTASFLEYTSSHCETTASGTCPSTLPYIGLPCSGHGRCNIACQCVCEAAPSVIEIDATALDHASSPYRGDGCEVTCPGYDGYNMSSVCSNRGTCQQDGRCRCQSGFRGDACQFSCPMGPNKLVCSGHGACGEISYEGSTYTTTQVGYDIVEKDIVHKNAKSFQDAMHTYYDRCLDENFLPIVGKLDHIAVSSPEHSSTNKSNASVVCNDINRHLADNTVGFVPGQCIGLVLNNSHYVPMLLKPIVAKVKPISDNTFTCRVWVDCSIKKADSFSFEGATHSLSGATFTFVMQYIHRVVNRSLEYVINGLSVTLDVTWTPTSWSLQMAGVEMTEQGEWARVKMEISNRTLSVYLYPVVEPQLVEPHLVEPHLVEPPADIFWAPNFMNNYLKMPSVTDSYYYSSYQYYHNATHHCDLDEQCVGIVRWESVQQGRYFSLLTTQKGTSVYGSVSYYAKMSKLYKGRKDMLTPCAPVEAGRAVYPKVNYVEVYNTPLPSVDTTAVRHLVNKTKEIVIPVGDGIWTKCWEKIPDKCTQFECYNKTHSRNAHGFAWSAVTKTCLVYRQFATPIKLDKWTDNAGRTDYQPCGRGNGTTWQQV